ncbi:MAG: acyl-CoA/acyl-ACP dehydrogenase [SAR86 cluster bacterium]|uniref:Acyl-CoA/acyl-ACP dehydrogenase n=1 Tax=SAR86 cluster bacterium TaxID=2030880 RepID=A0A973A915_9GAMM|nr:acyl-CoA/acyl-ACP dehydrogenase [SAR86 cluster bacterium]
MDFNFTEEQLAFRDGVADILRDEVTPATIRRRWDSDTGLDAGLSHRLIDFGLPAMLVPEDMGGLGLSEVDFILLAQACGSVALPEPLVDEALVATPLLVEIANTTMTGGERARALLPEVANGTTRVAIGHWINPYINFADSADLLLLAHGDEVHLIAASDAQLVSQRSLDPSRRLSKITWQPSQASRLADGPVAATLWRCALNRGALGIAAQLLGLAEAMLQQTVQYSIDRQQFGRSIGANQAVKHLLADCAVKIEFAKPAVYRAAYTVSVAPARADFAVSHAKVAAGQAALLCAKNCMQVHGAMGYTWECDLQIWMKRSWALDKNWGDAGFHKNRIHEWLLRPGALLGADQTFGNAHLAVVAE